MVRPMTPAAASAGLEHAWGGVLGVPRDWCATVTLDASAQDVPKSSVTTLISTAQSADRSLLNVQPGGAAIENVAGRERSALETAGFRLADYYFTAARR